MPRKSSLTGAANAELDSSLYLDADGFADQRQEEIVLDHAMAKSSNVGTPEEEEAEAPVASPVSASNGIGHSAPDSQQQVPAPLPFVTEKRRTATADVEDDFFSMNFAAVYEEPRKKKKKKRVAKHTKLMTPDFLSAASPSSRETSATPVAKKKDPIPEDADIIVLEDDDEPAPKPTKAKRRLTPPPFDEEEFRKTLREKALDRMSTNIDYDPQFDDYEESQFDVKMRKMRQMADNMAIPKSLTRSDNAGFGDCEEEGKAPRNYKLNITSFLPGSAEIAVDVDITGNKKFAKVTSKILKHLLNSQVHSQEYAEEYTPDNVQLLWKDIRITDYMRPDTLSIEEPVDGSATVLELGLYTKEQVNLIEQEKSSEKRRKLLQAQEEEELDRMAKRQAAAAALGEPEEDKYDEAYREIDQEIAARDAAKSASAAYGATGSASAEPEKEDVEGYFKIGLKGVDNKKLVVRVNNATKMAKLVAYYLQQKALPETTTVRLVFDDEDIPLTQTVGDTELEEDFTVEVYLL